MTENIIIRLLILGGSLYLFLNLFALLRSNSMIFAPQPSRYTHLPHEFKLISGNHEKINAVYLEHPTAAYTIHFSHGNAEDLENVVPFMQQFYELGYSVLMYEYRGYGTSEGRPSVRKVYQDAAAAYRWLVEEKKIPPQKILAQGRSVGGGPAAWLAAHYPVGGLILESTFVSAFRVKTRWPLLPWDKFNNIQHVRKTNCPVLVIHGFDDDIIPIWHGKALFEAARGKKMNLWIEEAHHNNYAYVAGDDYFDTFRSFVELISKN